jgi:predicted transcriptional regulator
MKKPAKPSDFELAVLDVLWRAGPSTVRTVHETFQTDRPIAYTTVLKTMQRMFEKGLVTRDESATAHVYSAAVERGATQTSILKNVLANAFSGSAKSLVISALASEKLSRDDMREIEALLKELREDQG